jgi:hypothetical protein
LNLRDRVPDARTLAQAGNVEELLSLFDPHLSRQGYVARGGQSLHVSTVPAPRTHITRNENAAINDGEVPKPKVRKAKCAAHGQPRRNPSRSTRRPCCRGRHDKDSDLGAKFDEFFKLGQGRW